MENESINWSDWFYYDETSPSCIRWKVDIYNRKGILTKAKRGTVAGGKKVDKGAYYKVKFRAKQYYVHNIVVGLYGHYILKNMLVDHIDGNGLNNKIDNLRLIPKEQNTRNAKRNVLNSSGVAGVSIVKICNRGYSDIVARAEWYNLNGEKKSKQFSFIKYGKDLAIQLAASARNSAIEQLNKQGAGYTERHGEIYEHEQD